MKYVIRDDERKGFRALNTIKGAVQKVEFDFSPWADSNGALTSATWTVVSGNASIASEALASSLASATVSTVDEGVSVIEVKGINASFTQPVRLKIAAKAPHEPYYGDYGRALWR